MVISKFNKSELASDITFCPLILNFDCEKSILSMNNPCNFRYIIFEMAEIANNLFSLMLRGFIHGVLSDHKSKIYIQIIKLIGICCLVLFFRLKGSAENSGQNTLML